MKIVSTAALALALMAGGAITPSPALAKEKAPKAAAANYTPAVREAAAAAQAAIGKGDLETAKTQLATAEAAMKNDDDKYIVGALTLQVSQKNGDQTLLPKAIGMMVDSGKAPPEQLAQLQMARGKLAFQAKDYATAERSLLAAQQAGSTDPDLIPVLVEVEHQNSRDLIALQTLNQAIDKQVAAGQPVPDTWYQRGIAIGYQSKAPAADKAQMAPIISSLTSKWIAAYPTKSNWRDALLIYRDSNRIDPEQEIDMDRLLRSAGALNGERDYMEYVLATYLRYPGEAKAVLEQGIQVGAVNPTGKNASEIRGIVTKKIPEDKASLPGSDKAARASANGKVALSTADAYLGYEDWAKAIDLYKVALAKGGVDADVVNTRMGYALLKSGDKAGAKAAFAAVKGQRKPLADFWAIYVDHPPAA